MIAAVAYDMHRECAKGKLNMDWKLEWKEIASHHQFWDELF
jgi:hypothetical protein